MFNLYKLEFKKIQWSILIFLILLDTIINASLGAMFMKSNSWYFPPSWSELYIQSLSFHALFFYPLYVGIITSLVCFYEHKNNAWKQLMCLPISKTNLYVAKFMFITTLLAITQLTFFIGYFITGWIIQPPGKLDVINYIIYGILGWLAMWPLVALQLWISQKIKNFGRSLLINIFLVLPNVVVATGFPSYIAAWFPFSLSYFAMYPQGSVLSPDFHPIFFWSIAFFTSILYFYIGLTYFINRNWN
ncbi:ABC transporter permease [Hazenella sp. IB182357]|uniref:ABC transporter permease n=1 Tax=Polycladospora coralii TaxID=2771432 RepID=A0A926NDQ1_9BACL|nr:ABC transporter permease [Polycladospora coralii]MBD1371679.1 ABC transporter permease [Polycladospora coralii]MBS7529146.1 ABC transporter permease [Polycladospora coralii]